MGAMTGRAAGYCAGYQGPGHMNSGRGGGFGRGMGRGFRAGGFGRGLAWVPRPPMYAPYGGVPQAPTREEEVAALKAQAEGFKEALSDIEARMQELDSGTE